MSQFEIAQLNVGRAAPLDDAVMADFMNWLDEINALAAADRSRPTDRAVRRRTLGEPGRWTLLERKSSCESH